MPKRKAINLRKYAVMTEAKNAKRKQNEIEENSSIQSLVICFSESPNVENESQKDLDEHEDFDLRPFDYNNDEQLFALRTGCKYIIEYEASVVGAVLVPFDGNDKDVSEIVGVNWQNDDGNLTQMTIGYTNLTYKAWANNAYYNGKYAVANPLMHKAACRCVIMAIQQGLTMMPDSAFGFNIFVRTKELQEKVKGYIIKITQCIHKGGACDDAHILDTVLGHINEKVNDCLALMPHFNQCTLEQFFSQ